MSYKLGPIVILNVALRYENVSQKIVQHENTKFTKEHGIVPCTFVNFVFLC